MINKEYYLSLSKDAQDHYLHYKKEAESSVSRREYARDKLYDITPCWYGRESTVPGEITEEETDIYYEFDNRGRLRISACDELIDGYAYTNYEENRIITRLYVSSELYSIKEYTIHNGLINRCVEYSPRFDKLRYEDYLYEGEKLIQVYQPQYEGSAGLYDHLVHTFFEYDEKGTLKQVLDGNREVIYIQMKAEEVALLRQEVKDRLTSRITEVISQITKVLVNDSCCFLAIFLHDEVEGLYSPIFHPGLQKVRDEQVRDKKDYWTIWNPAEHPVNNQQELIDRDLIRKLRTLVYCWHHSQDWWEEGVKLWQEVAYTVNESNWFLHPVLTEDFIVFIDWSGMDIVNGDLEECVTPTKLEIIRSKGLLPL